MGIFICKICQKECNGLSGIQSHNALIHKLNSDETYLEYVLNDIKPKCGCGDITPFISCGKGYSKFIQSHHNRVPGKNNLCKNHNIKLLRYWEKDINERP